MEFLFTILVTCSQLRFACGWWPIRQRSWIVQKWQKPSPMCQPRRCGLQGNSNVATWEHVKRRRRSLNNLCSCAYFMSFLLSSATSNRKTRIRLYVYLAATSLQFGWFLGQLGDWWSGMVATGTGADVTVTSVTSIFTTGSCRKLGRFAWMIAPNDCKAADSLMVEGMPFFWPWPWRCQKVWLCHLSSLDWGVGTIMRI